MERFFERGLVIDERHVNPRGHDLPGGGISEFEHRVKHFTFFLLDCALLLPDIDPFFDLVLGHGRLGLSLIIVPPTHYPVDCKDYG